MTAALHTSSTVPGAKVPQLPDGTRLPPPRLSAALMMPDAKTSEKKIRTSE
jgi:hypothetical protein